MKDSYSKKSNTSFILIVVSLCLIIVSLVVVIVFFDEFKSAFSKDEGSSPTLAPSATATLQPTELLPPTEQVTMAPTPTARPEEIIVTNNTVGTRFTAPQGFERVPVQDGSFEAYLRNFSLKTYGTVAMMHDPETKAMIEATDASTMGVFNIELINTGNLQGAAGSIIRLRAEYFRSVGNLEGISFELCTTPAFVCDYKTWTDGGRLDKTLISDDKLSWCINHGVNGEECGHKDVTLGDTDGSFRYYLQNVMTYSNVASLRLQMKKMSISDVQIGDVFCSTEGKGLALIVVDVATDASGKKTFIVAGGGNPATDIHVYENTENPDMNVWQMADINGTFKCNGFTFTNVYRFK